MAWDPDRHPRDEKTGRFVSAGSLGKWANAPKKQTAGKGKAVAPSSPKSATLKGASSKSLASEAKLKAPAKANAIPNAKLKSAEKTVPKPSLKKWAESKSGSKTAPKAPIVQPHEDALKAVQAVASTHPDGALLLTSDVRAKSNLSKEDFDKAVWKLKTDGKVILHHHDMPHGIPANERNELVKHGEVYYTGIALTKAAEKAPDTVGPSVKAWANSKAPKASAQNDPRTALLPPDHPVRNMSKEHQTAYHDHFAAALSGKPPKLSNGAKHAINQWKLNSTEPHALALQHAVHELGLSSMKPPEHSYSPDGKPLPNMKKSEVNLVSDALKIYAATQAHFALARQEGKKISTQLFRGISGNMGNRIAAGAKSGDTIANRPLASWAARQDRAEDFAEKGVLMKSAVPEHAIFSTYESRFGTLGTISEQEVVVLGKPLVIDRRAESYMPKYQDSPISVLHIKQAA